LDQLFQLISKLMAHLPGISQQEMRISPSCHLLFATLPNQNRFKVNSISMTLIKNNLATVYLIVFPALLPCVYPIRTVALAGYSISCFVSNGEVVVSISFLLHFENSFFDLVVPANNFPCVNVDLEIDVITAADANATRNISINGFAVWEID
jgi:hypothetical protein